MVLRSLVCQCRTEKLRPRVRNMNSLTHGSATCSRKIRWSSSPHPQSLQLLAHDGSIGISDLFPILNEYCQYYSPYRSILAAVTGLEQYIAAEGPFDVVTACSMGAIFAVSSLVLQSQQDALDNDFGFKCAMYNFGSLLYDCAILVQGKLSMYQGRAQGTMIHGQNLGHAWSRVDAGVELAKLCDAAARTDFLHNAVHQNGIYACRLLFAGAFARNWFFTKPNVLCWSTLLPKCKPSESFAISNHPPGY